jgi:NAD(P)-dependent dehydrogenase (short-subunit alcohol dehydrogenase family)
MSEGGHASGVAIVTGAVGGMGSECARLLAKDGWRELLLCDLDDARLEAVAAPLRKNGAKIATLAADITDREFTARLIDRLGPREIGALIHSAGIAPQMAEPTRVFEINLDASLRLLGALRPRMAENSAAVLFASIAGYLPVSPEAEAAFERPIPPEGSMSLRHFASDSNEAYLLSKRAIIATVKREAKAFGERNARLVSVSPGLIDTAMTRGVENPLTIRLLADAAVPRMGRPEEVAAACVFLCSPAASFITGCDLRVDGGELAGLGI